MSQENKTTPSLLSAVLTGDIVNSTSLSALRSKELIRGMEESFGSNPFEFYRGDAFQVYVAETADALKIALLCRCLAISVSGGNELPGDVRIGIGIGLVETPVGKLGTARGEAFLLSGRGFDGLADSGDRLIIAARGEWPSLALAILSDEINGIFSALTARQAEVLIEMLRGSTQREASLRLEKSQSTIHQHLVAARWSQIEKCMRHYLGIVTLINQ